MSRRTVLAGGWLATTVVATVVCAAGVSLVTSDMTEPRRDAMAVAELRALEAAARDDAPPSRSEHIDLDLTAAQAPDAATTARTVVSDGGVLSASCPGPVRLDSVRPNDGFRVVVLDEDPGVIEVRFIGADRTEVHLLSCGPDEVQVDTPTATELAAPVPREPEGDMAPSSQPGEELPALAAPTGDDLDDGHHGDEDPNRRRGLSTADARGEARPGEHGDRRDGWCQGDEDDRRDDPGDGDDDRRDDDPGDGAGRDQRRDDHSGDHPGDDLADDSRGDGREADDGGGSRPAAGEAEPDVDRGGRRR